MSLTGRDIIIDVTRVFGNGKVYLPAEVRNALQLKDGDKVAFSQDEAERIILTKVLKKESRVGKYSVKNGAR